MYGWIAYFQTQDATRSLVKNLNKPKDSPQPVSSAGGSALVTSLRQQVHSLECALREREKETNELKQGLAASRLHEMQVQTETYYREIRR